MRTGLGVAALLFILVVLTIARSSSHTFPVSDDAIIELSTLNAAQGHQRLGPYSRYAWHHPGPALFYLLAPFYSGSGGRSAGLASGALTINVAALAALLWLLLRFGGPALALAFAVAAAFYVSRLGGLLVSSWNAHAAILTAAAILVSGAAAAAAAGAIPLFAILASFALQTHVATLPVVIVCGGIVIVQVIRNGGIPRRTSIGTVAVLGLLWAVPLFEQVSPQGGNMTKMWQFLGSPSRGAEPAIAFEAWADMLTAPGSQGLAIPRGLLLPHDGPGARGVAAVAGLILIAAVGVWAHRTGRRFHLWLAIELFCVGIAGLLAVSRIPDGIHDHEVFWLSTVGLLIGASVLAVPMTLLSERVTSRLALFSCLLFIAGVAAYGIRELMGVVERSHVMRHEDRRTEQATRAVEGAIAKAGSRRSKILMDQPVWETAAGVVLQLRKKGVSVAVEPGLERMFSGTVAADGTEDLEIAFCGGPCHERLIARPGNTVVLFGDGLAIDAIALR